jgi:hypothetical protein
MSEAERRIDPSKLPYSLSLVRANNGRALTKTASEEAVNEQRFIVMIIHFHMLYLDGVYAEDNYGKTRLDEKHPCFSPYGQPLVVQPVYLE